jgi:tetratricopeptide (TPR) repeat protein
MRTSKPAFLISLFVAGAAFSRAHASLAPVGSVKESLSNAVILFEQHHLDEAMNAFLQVLRLDPANERAHAYVDLIAKEISIQRHSQLQEKRLEMLSDLSKRLEESQQDPAPIQKAMEETTQSEDRARQERWHAQCEQARMQNGLGHLLQANDLVLKILAENPSCAEAQRLLSELQSDIRRALDHGADYSIEERYALEGFYAFGQADYGGAYAAWEKVRAVVAQAVAPAEVAARLQMLRFEPYQERAKIEVDQEKHQAELRALFERGLGLYRNSRSMEALEVFRQLAIQEPDYPLLGKYLVQTEADAEKERARRLGEHKRRQLAQYVQEGLTALESEQYQKAAADFEAALALDPSYPQARSYLSMAKTEMTRRHDPKAAQMHYETGLVAYAGGKLEDAIREWKIAIRMDPHHEKAANALGKAQKELAYNREGP